MEDVHWLAMNSSRLCTDSNIFFDRDQKSYNSLKMAHGGSKVAPTVFKYGHILNNYSTSARWI